MGAAADKIFLPADKRKRYEMFRKHKSQKRERERKEGMSERKPANAGWGTERREGAKEVDEYEKKESSIAFQV